MFHNNSVNGLTTQGNLYTFEMHILNAYIKMHILKSHICKCVCVCIYEGGRECDLIIITTWNIAPLLEVSVNYIVGFFLISHRKTRGENNGILQIIRKI